MWFLQGIWRNPLLPCGSGTERLTAAGESRYLHPVALFRRIVCTWWTRAKFKHTVPDSSSQQSHYPGCAQAPGGRNWQVFLESPPSTPSPRLHRPVHYLILLFTLTHSWLSHVWPKNRKVKPLVVPTINLVPSHLVLYLSPSHEHTHIYRCFIFYMQAAGGMCLFIELWLCQMSEDGNVW